MSDITILSIDLIIANPKIRQGRPILAGTTLRVQDVVEAHQFKGYSPETIAEQYQITLGQVYAALAYYHEHRAELDAQIAADERFYDQAKEQRRGQRHLPLLGRKS